MDDLKLVLTKNMEHLIWTEEEDDILDKCKDSKDSAEYRLLVRIKGERSVKRRIKFNYWFFWVC